MTLTTLEVVIGVLCLLVIFVCIGSLKGLVMAEDEKKEEQPKAPVGVTPPGKPGPAENTTAYDYKHKASTVNKMSSDYKP